MVILYSCKLASENHLEKRLWLLISTSCEFEYLWLSRIAIFCASALQRDVFPVPGGPWSSTTLFQLIMLLFTPRSENNMVVWTKLSNSFFTSLSYISVSHSPWNSEDGSCQWVAAGTSSSLSSISWSSGPESSIVKTWNWCSTDVPLQT